MTRPTTTGKAQDLITFTRSTTGTYLGSDGLLKSAAINEARIEYDASGNCLGLLVEEARTNLFRYSQEFSNVEHSLITTDNATVSPDGTQNASLCIPTSANVEHYIDDQNVIAGTDYAMSCFAKYGSGSYLLSFRGSGIGGVPPQFNLQTGTVVNEGASSVWSNTKIEDVGNGWYKCSSVGNPNTTTPLRFQLIPSAGAVSFTGDGTGHYIWGIQVEQKSFPTSYIPTSGSTVTRAADVASLAVSEFGYNQDQFSVVVESDFFADSDTRPLVYIGESNSDRILLYRGSGAIKLQVKSANNTEVQDSIYDDIKKAAFRYKKDDMVLAANGLTTSTDTSASLLAVEGLNIYIGRYNGGAPFLNGHIKSIQYYPLGLSNAQLQALTV
jgi:hypothetical protein